MEKKQRRTTKPEEVAAIWVSAEELVPWEENPRLNDGAAVEKVAASIKRFGFAAPIVARSEDKMVIAGHTRLKAAIELGLDKVPVRFVDLDPADARMLAIADNRVREEASWNIGALPNILAALELDGLDLGDLGFGLSELDAIMGRADPDEKSPEEFADFDGDDLEASHECPKCGYEWR